MDRSPACNRYREGEKITPELFLEMCKEHDLTYEYSDDSRYYNRGRDQHKAIEAAAKELPAGIAAQIWNKVVAEKVLPDSQSMFMW